MNPSNLAVSLLRTGVPAAWGAALAFLLVHAPWIPHVVVAYLQGQETAVTGAVIFLWYAAWRWAEKRLPTWLTRLVLGSAQAPSYVAPVLAAAPVLSLVGEKGPQVVTLPAAATVTPTKPTPPADPTPPAAA